MFGLSNLKLHQHLIEERIWTTLIYITVYRPCTLFEKQVIVTCNMFVSFSEASTKFSDIKLSHCH